MILKLLVSTVKSSINGIKTEAITYWKNLICFLNNKKLPSVPPLLVNGETVSNFFKLAVLLINVLHYNVHF